MNDNFDILPAFVEARDTIISRDDAAFVEARDTIISKGDAAFVEARDTIISRGDAAFVEARDFDDIPDLVDARDNVIPRIGGHIPPMELHPDFGEIDYNAPHMIFHGDANGDLDMQYCGKFKKWLAIIGNKKIDLLDFYERFERIENIVKRFEESELANRFERIEGIVNDMVDFQPGGEGYKRTEQSFYDKCS